MQYQIGCYECGCLAREADTDELAREIAKDVGFGMALGSDGMAHFFLCACCLPLYYSPAPISTDR